MAKLLIAMWFAVTWTWNPDLLSHAKISYICV